MSFGLGDIVKNLPLLNFFTSDNEGAELLANTVSLAANGAIYVLGKASKEGENCEEFIEMAERFELLAGFLCVPMAIKNFWCAVRDEGLVSIKVLGECSTLSINLLSAIAYLEEHAFIALGAYSSFLTPAFHICFVASGFISLKATCSQRYEELKASDHIKIFKLCLSILQSTMQIISMLFFGVEGTFVMYSGLMLSLTAGRVVLAVAEKMHEIAQDF